MFGRCNSAMLVLSIISVVGGGLNGCAQHATRTEPEKLRILVDGDIAGTNEKDRKERLDKILRDDRTKSGGEKKRLSGFASLVKRSFDAIEEHETNVLDICAEALEKKRRWHQEHTGTVPVAFGQIVNYEMYEAAPKSWAGRIDLCSLIGTEKYTDVYYLEMEFTEEKPLIAHENQGEENGYFPDTLDLSALDEEQRKAMLEMMGEWKWKLHAEGDAIIFIKALRNGVDIPDGDPLYDSDGNCFDMFLNKEPAATLPNQLNYCLGRCDARILNTK